VYYITEMWVLAFSCCPQPTIFIDALTGTCYTWTANSRMFFHVLLFFVFFWAKLRVFHRHFCEVFFLSLFLVYVSVFFFFFYFLCIFFSTRFIPSFLFFLFGGWWRRLPVFCYKSVNFSERLIWVRVVLHSIAVYPLKNPPKKFTRLSFSSLFHEISNSGYSARLLLMDEGKHRQRRLIRFVGHYY
jgi:hypothetical protein